MLRYLRRALLALGMVLATACGATAAQAVTVNVYDQTSSEEESKDLDIPTLVNGAVDLATTIKAVSDGQAVPEVNNSNGVLNIVLDPRTIQSVVNLVTPGNSAWNSVTYGRTATGQAVAFPTSGTFTSPYGPRWGTMHQGIDIANNIGTPIVAVMDGTVIDAGAAQGFGQWVRVKHDDGAISVYGHVESFNASVGQRVTAGQQIATMGNRGHSTGPHLHFEIRPDGNTPVDPVPWFAQRGITVNQ